MGAVTKTANAQIAQRSKDAAGPYSRIESSQPLRTEEPLPPGPPLASPLLQGLPPAKAAAAKRAAAKPAAAKSTAAKRTARQAGRRQERRRQARGQDCCRQARRRRRQRRSRPGGPRPRLPGPQPAKTAARKNGATAKSSPRVTIRVNAENVQVEAIAERLRKLNERIIEFGREAGESTLTSYEKALKAIANGVSQSPAKDELEWITQLAASQAKFVRDITDSWAKAARERLK